MAVFPISFFVHNTPSWRKNQALCREKGGADMIFHIAVCSPDPVLRGRVQRHCMEYYARRADACIVEQLESTAALLQQESCAAGVCGPRWPFWLTPQPMPTKRSGWTRCSTCISRSVRSS